MSAIASGPKPSSWKLIRGGLRFVWDSLGLILAGSLLWSLCLMAVIAFVRFVVRSHSQNVSALFDALLVPIAVAPVASGIAYSLHCAANGSIAGGDRLREGIRIYGRKLLPVVCIQFWVATVMMLAGLIYLRWGGLFAFLGVVSLYFLGAWLAFCLFWTSVYIEQEEGAFDDPDKKATRGARAAARRAASLALRHPAPAIALTAVVTLMGILCVASVVLFVIFWIGAVSALACHVVRGLLVAEEILPAPPETEHR